MLLRGVKRSEQNMSAHDRSQERKKVFWGPGQHKSQILDRVRKKNSNEDVPSDDKAWKNPAAESEYK